MSNKDDEKLTFSICLKSEGDIPPLAPHGSDATENAHPPLSQWQTRDRRLQMFLR